MKSRRTFVKAMGFLVAMVVLVSSVVSNYTVHAVTKTAETKVEYITVADFIKRLVKASNIKVSKGNMPYITAAYDAGILMDGDVTSYNAIITREEAAVLLNRADELLHRNKLEEAYVNKIIERRISDIHLIQKKNQEAVAKMYGRGIIKGYTNGYGVQSRQFRGTEKLTLRDAKIYIYKMKYPKKRAKLSPDAQLIRTTNLPKNADKFPYILECFPNKFYEKKFDYQYIISSTSPIEQGITYDFPVNMRKRKLHNTLESFDMGEQMDLYLYDWADRIQDYVHLTFNVDYKTIGEQWANTLRETTAYDSQRENMIADYISAVKSNHVTVQTRKIAVEPSTFYYSDGLFMRVYVEYKVTADKYTDDLRDYLYYRGGNIWEFKLGEWVTSYLDIEMSNTNPHYGDGSTYGAFCTWYDTDE